MSLPLVLLYLYSILFNQCWIIIFVFTWKVRLKGGPITPGSSKDRSDLMSYRDGFESLEVKNKK